MRRVSGLSSAESSAQKIYLGYTVLIMFFSAFSSRECILMVDLRRLFYYRVRVDMHGKGIHE